MNIEEIEASRKPCSKCKHARPDTRMKEKIKQMDFAKCAVSPNNYFCTTERGVGSRCGPKGSKWDPVNDEDRRKADMAEYNLGTHTPVRDIVLLPGAFLAFCGVIFWVCILFVPSSSSENSGVAREWRTKYYKLSCSSRGLELNTRNTNAFCMDPKTRAIYEID